MTQDELWNKRYEQLWHFLTQHHRRPSKYNTDEHQLLNWLRRNRRGLERGLMSDDRAGRMQQLLALAVRYQRINQHAYLAEEDQSLELHVPGKAASEGQ